ncbi:FAD-dependent oxidoreductase [Streptomyces sp. NPDC048291]|uniref:FAD-dependent oxidoreductase n=1 Tax=Streptomyces sp. NPDC048291 TaxID=3365530 RepID=UPI0037192F04
MAQTARFGHSPYGFFGAPMERFVGGAGVLLDRMVEQSRLEIRLGHHVTRIEQSEDAVTVRTRDGQSVRARSCVVAEPTNVLRHIEFLPGLSTDKNRFLARNRQGRASKPSMVVRNVPPRSFALGTGTLRPSVLAMSSSTDPVC